MISSYFTPVDGGCKHKMARIAFICFDDLFRPGCIGVWLFSTGSPTSQPAAAVDGVGSPACASVIIAMNPRFSARACT